ncbi:MAG TPA: hypothetical protein VHE35_24025 [Kofleriaceae bacterium]|nr:hypothetical protein [Kofleriaceae bacterium]
MFASLAALAALAACHGTAPPKAPVERSAAPPAGGPAAAAPEETALPSEPPPAGFEWRDRKGDRALAAQVDGETGDVGGTCEVWDLRRHQRLGVTDGADVSAGGADPACDALSPRGTLVEWGNGRNTVWKDLQNRVTACRGVVAPDDASCIEEDVTPFMLAGRDGHGDDLELHWSRPDAAEAADAGNAGGAEKVVVTIPDGLDRDSPDERWWHVRYCSAGTAVIDLRDGQRVVVDAATGDTRAVHVAPGAPPCP